MEKFQQYVKVALIFAAVFAFRLIPFRAPNVEPILASAMPLGKRSGALVSALFAALSIVLYDAVTSGWGSWTAITAIMYALVAFGAGLFFKNRAASRINFVSYSIAGVLFYDAATGLLPGPLLYGQSWSAAMSGQIPFTILHLLGSVAFAALVSPAIYRWLESSAVLSLAPKTRVVSGV